ncbi:hypothetical protein ACLOJK_021255 [Asimina triloba]
MAIFLPAGKRGGEKRGIFKGFSTEKEGSYGDDTRATPGKVQVRLYYVGQARVRYLTSCFLKRSLTAEIE